MQTSCRSGPGGPPQLSSASCGGATTCAPSASCPSRGGGNAAVPWPPSLKRFAGLVEVCMCSSAAAYACTGIAGNIRWACNAICMASIDQGRAVQACGTLEECVQLREAQLQLRLGAATSQFASCKHGSATSCCQLTSEGCMHISRRASCATSLPGPYPGRGISAACAAPESSS